MKKILILSALLLTACLSSFAQNITDPQVESSDDRSTSIKKIETTDKFTVISFEYTAYSDNSWLQLNKGIYIQTDIDNQRYDYVKSNNIAIYPARNTMTKAGDKLLFTVYFKKIPAEAKFIDVVERAGIRKKGFSFFNFYNVSLTQTRLSGKTMTDVTLIPPPPVRRDSARGDMHYGGAEMHVAIDHIEPMYTRMAKSIMDAQLDYYRQPGKIDEVAKLTKQYFDALIKAGFDDNQALKITTSNGLLSKSAPAEW